MRALLLTLGAAVLATAQPPYYTSIKPNAYVHELPVNKGSAALWQSLKKLHTRASLIMITAHPDIRLAVRAMKTGAMAFLEKPVQYDELLATIRKALGETDNPVESQT